MSQNREDLEKMTSAELTAYIGQVKAQTSAEYARIKQGIKGMVQLRDQKAAAEKQAEKDRIVAKKNKAKPEGE